MTLFFDVTREEGQQKTDEISEEGWWSHENNINICFHQGKVNRVAV